MNVMQRLRELREDHDVSQVQIADLLHVGQKTYSDYELGKTRIPLESAIRLAKFYDVSMDYLCGISNVKSCYPRK